MIKKVLIGFIISKLLITLYFLDDTTRGIIVRILLQYTVETSLVYALLILILPYINKSSFDHNDFLKKYKPIVNNLKQMHFYKRKTTVIKNGRICHFKDTYD